MEYVLQGMDESENHGKLTIQDSRYHEDEIYVTIEYPGEEFLILVSRGDLLAMAHGMIGAAEKYTSGDEQGKESA